MNDKEEDDRAEGEVEGSDGGIVMFSGLADDPEALARRWTLSC
jgi:hypothetical protein